MSKAYPFLAEGGLGSEGVFVGTDVHAGGAFVYDPWVLYAAGVLTNLLKSLEGQAESAAMFKELGTSGAGMETDAWGIIEKRAGEIVTESHVTKAVAISKALEERPELYAEYRKQVK